MIEVWEKQGKPNAAIMFVVEDITYNICDQVRFFKFYLDCACLFHLSPDAERTFLSD